MDIFFTTLNQMLLMFLLIFVGILLRKNKILPNDTDTVLARLETYVLAPGLTFFSWAENCTPKSLIENAELILYGLILIVVAVLLSEPLSRLFVHDLWGSEKSVYERHIYKYAMTFGNYGFIGNFIVLNIWGSERFFQYSMFTMGATLLSSSWGLLLLIPRHKGQKETIKSMIRHAFPPPMIALIVGCVVGLLNLKQFIPGFVLDACNNAGSCYGPVAMILAGFVIGGYDWKNLLGHKKVYVASFFRLILIPSVFVVLLKVFGANDTILTFALIVLGTPVGLNTIVYPAAYGGDTKTGASMTMISTVCSVITIPLMYLVFVGGL